MLGEGRLRDLVVAFLFALCPLQINFSHIIGNIDRHTMQFPLQPTIKKLHELA